LSSIAPPGKALAMGDATDKLTREERLAAKLRENLRRRKAQSRALHAAKPPLSKEDPKR
jgi:hypothetical protein